MTTSEVEEYTEYLYTLDILRGATRRLRRRSMRELTRSTNENSSRDGYGLLLNE